MIYTAEHIREPLRITADLCVIGSGAGGATAAAAAAEHGLRVVVVEAGSFLTPADFTGLEHEMFPKLYQENASRTTSDHAMRVHQGKGVGGSTLHNLGLCVRLPSGVRARWRAEQGLAALTDPVLDMLFDSTEERLAVRQLHEGHLNRNNEVLRRGCEALGYRGGFLRDNRSGCVGSGFCELGCSFDAKNNALKVFIADAVRHGTRVLADTWAVGIDHDGRRVRGVDAVVRDPVDGREGPRVRIDARAVCVSAGATATPAILERSGVPDPWSLIGSRLFLHPGIAVAGVFDESIHAWQGVPQSWECREWLDLDALDPDRRLWITSAFAHPAGVSSVMPGFGGEHARLMADYPRLAAIGAMVHDTTVGRVAASGRWGVSIDYWPGSSDREQLARGVIEGARILLAAGASRVVLPFSRTIEIESARELDGLSAHLDIRRHDLDIASVHPMGSVWMGDDPRTSCVDAYGRCHHLDNLFVADASLFPTSIGVPPQLSTFALGWYVGSSILNLLQTGEAPR